MLLGTISLARYNYTTGGWLKMSELTDSLKAELLDLNKEFSESEQEIQEQKLIIERAESEIEDLEERQAEIRAEVQKLEAEIFESLPLEERLNKQVDSRIAEQLTLLP